MNHHMEFTYAWEIIYNLVSPSMQTWLWFQQLNGGCDITSRLEVASDIQKFSVVVHVYECFVGY